jgi:hypothetical protein
MGQRWALGEHGTEVLGSIKGCEVFDMLNDYQLLNNNFTESS